MVGARSIDAQGLTEYVLYARGMLRGMRLLIRQPDVTAKQIERELAKAREEQHGEEE